jgi:hypothetical protein
MKMEIIKLNCTIFFSSSAAAGLPMAIGTTRSNWERRRRHKNTELTPIKLEFIFYWILRMEFEMWELGKEVILDWIVTPPPVYYNSRILPQFHSNKKSIPIPFPSLSLRPHPPFLRSPKCHPTHKTCFELTPHQNKGDLEMPLLFFCNESLGNDKMDKLQ